MSDSRLPAETPRGSPTPSERKASAGRPTSSSSAEPASSARTSSIGWWPSGPPSRSSTTSPRVRSPTSPMPGRPRRAAAAELHIHTLDATSPDLATLITLRRPRHVVHLALLVPAAPSVAELGKSFTSMLGVLDACRAASVEKVIVRPPRDGALRHPVSAPVARQGGRDHPAWRAWRRCQGDRRAVDDVPPGPRHRVHGAGARRPCTGRVSFPSGAPWPGCSTLRPTVSRRGSPATAARPATSSTSTTSSTPWSRTRHRGSGTGDQRRDRRPDLVA